MHIEPGNYIPNGNKVNIYVTLLSTLQWEACEVIRTSDMKTFVLRCESVYLVTFTCNFVLLQFITRITGTAERTFQLNTYLCTIVIIDHTIKYV